MTRQKARHLLEQQIELQQAFPRDTKNFRACYLTLELNRLGLQAKRLAKDRCNRNEKTEGEFERRAEGITKRVRNLFAGSVIVSVDGDPRGRCLTVSPRLTSCGVSF